MSEQEGKLAQQHKEYLVKKQTTTDFSLLNLVTHNINGLKVNSYKLDLLVEWALENNIDILGINETNISEQQGKFLCNKRNNYVGFWTGACENKLKGSGVGLLVNKTWEKHIGRVTRYSNYYIDILIFFKKYKLLIISVYIPPNNKEEKKRIQQQVIRRTRECEKDQIKVIVMGDFNDIRSKELDQSKEESSRKQALPLLRWLENSKLDDIFRKMHLYKKEYTWSNRICIPE